jgi:hypothetical protein
MYHRTKSQNLACLILASAAMLFSSPVRSQEAALLKELDQGWSDAQRIAWYSATQGSRLIPLAWLQSLEQPGNSGALFLEPQYIRSFL